MSSGNAPLPYQPPGQAGAASGYLASTGAQAGPAGQLLGQVSPLLGFAGNIANNPFNQQALTGAQGASAYGTGTLAPMEMGAAQSLTGAGNAATQYAGPTLASGYDPQGALYNQQYQQMLQQQNAINAQNGVAGSPYASGLTGQAAQNFNTNWVNQQLARQGQAAQNYATLTGAQNAAYTGGANLGQAGYQTLSGASGLPASTYSGQQLQSLEALISAITGGSAAFGPSQDLTAQLGRYLGIGQSATSIADQAAKINFDESTAGFSGLMNLLGIGSGANQTSALGLIGGLGSLIGL